MTSLSSDIVCGKCESPLDSRRIKLGLKDCIECSDTKAYRVHQVYPHKTGGYVQPISDQQADHLNKLDRRSTGGWNDITTIYIINQSEKNILKKFLKSSLISTTSPCINASSRNS